MVSYLRAACAFLASIADPTTLGSPETGSRRLPTEGGGSSGSTNMPYRRVLQDPDISLADRVAFACRFLPPMQLKVYLRQQGVACLEEGNLEGVLLFGLGGEGLNLLQAYVDRTGDIQTAALLTSRVGVWPERARDDANLSQEWMEGYRDLLDTCQLWHERAIFDVGRADHLSGLRRMYQSRSTSNAERGGERGRTGSREGDRDAVIKKTLGMQTAPAQLYVRCNYCNTPIQLNSLRRQGRMGQSWLSRQKPVMNCCPECRKPLPRCYICLLPLGCLNPYLELKRQLQQRQFPQVCL